MSEKLFDFEQGTIDRYIEGFLGDNKESRILFLLREPHTYNKNEPKKDQDDFWFKRILDDKDDLRCKLAFRNRHNLKYFNTYATFASYLLNIPNDQEALSAIRQCAYMNLFTIRGWQHRSTEYKKTKDFLIALLNGNSIPENEREGEESIRAHRVYRLLKYFVNNDTEYIVTVNDLYYDLKQFAIGKEFTWLDLPYMKRPKGSPDKTPRIRHFPGVTVRLFEKDVKLLWFWHPSNPTYQTKLLRGAVPEEYIIDVPPRAYRPERPTQT